ncbi:ubiquinol-cytochrome-c reductase complex assembly factor 2-like [Photinus pyralis]|uniref:Mitochondrial nucleoid factor 1 n=1 Tax=Photinus pyralis TaxID=7054 RepID=A0A1Y1M6P8_PHOPY|nr:ubiquinol-cytochrome-c reductase complex assembly factor 2-like [Photinus pyralis]XP_031350257.1 ubiquinol-cytochrome-c reductase complex assembly factor 2-like [Photinus pyralis]
MSSSGIYNRIIKLIERWPLDKNKPGRDLGQHLRDYITKANQDGSLSGNEKYWDKQYLAIQRLVNNEHGNKYIRSLSSTSTGLTAEQCSEALTKEVLDTLEKESRSLWEKIFYFRSSK